MGTRGTTGIAFAFAAGHRRVAIVSGGAPLGHGCHAGLVNHLAARKAFGLIVSPVCSTRGGNSVTGSRTSIARLNMGTNNGCCTALRTTLTTKRASVGLSRNR